MSHVTLATGEEDAPLAAFLLAKYGVFSPERGVLREEGVSISGGQRYREVYLQARRTLEEICRHCQNRPEEVEGVAEPPSVQQLEEVNRWLGELLELAHTCETTRGRVEREKVRDESLLAGLEPFKALDVNLALLKRPQRILDVRIGTFPAERLAPLSAALRDLGVLLEVLGKQEGRVMAVLVCPPEAADPLARILVSHGWEEWAMPPEYAGKPEEAERRIRGREAELANKAKGFFVRHEATCGHMKEQLAEARRLLALAEPYAMLVGELVPEQRGRFAISGWIPAANEKILKQRLDEKLAGHYDLQLRTPFPSERETVPSALRYPDWLGPFAELVRNYGTPCYGQFDPTLLFAISFMLMFGMMFGDVGHGLIIAMISVVLSGRARRFRALFLGAGLASMAFGLLYGSVFGLHDLFTPVWLCPVHHPMKMLKVAIGWGVGFVALSQIITLYNRLAVREFRAALLDVGGLSGALLYLGGVAGVHQFVTTGRFGDPALAACLGGIVGVLIFKWGEQTGAWMERLATTLFSGLETILMYFTNTISFIRIAAFSISHAALALAIITFADHMGSTPGRWLTLVIGNLVVLVLEGAIVAIQVLRLEYYEGFSRFFTCVGREFAPVGKAQPNKGIAAADQEPGGLEAVVPKNWKSERRYAKTPDV